MKTCLLILIILRSLSATAQYEGTVNIMPLVNFNAVLNRLGLNEAGMGLGCNVSFFAKRKLQLLFEGGTDRFIGDKLLRIDPVTRKFRQIIQ